MDLGLSGLKAVVTGGKRGIGRATAAVLAEEGCDVAICARDGAAVDAAVADLARHGTRVFGAGVDVADADAYRAWLADACHRLGGLDILVHNVSASAGSGEDGWRANLELDVFGLTRALEVVEPHLERSEHAAVVCMASIAALEEFAGPGSFGPMKAAMLVYASNLAHALAPKGIRVNTVSPGPVFFAGGSWDVIQQHMQPFYESTVKKMPIRRLGEPAEVARAVAFLASPAASLVTGTNLVIDGGFTRRVQF